jgi:hypothetical protein
VENCIKIIVEDGCVVDVEGLPDGWGYEIEDHDSGPFCQECGNLVEHKGHREDCPLIRED